MDEQPFEVGETVYFEKHGARYRGQVLSCGPRFTAVVYVPGFFCGDCVDFFETLKLSRTPLREGPR
jgi:hypothetical protein